MSPSKPSFCLACLIVGLISSVSASEPRLPWQQAELGWHLDMDAARRSTWARDAIDKVWNSPAMAEKLAAVPETLRPLASVTIRGVTFQQHHGTTVVAAELEGSLAALESTLRELPGSRREEVDGRTLHVTRTAAWRDLLADWLPADNSDGKDDEDSGGDRPLVFWLSENLVIAGDDLQAVARAVETASSAGAEHGRWPRGAVASAHSRRPVDELVELRQLTIRADRQLHLDCRLRFACNSAAQAVHAMLAPDSLITLAAFPGELQPPVEDVSEPAGGDDSLLTFAAMFDGFRLPEDRERILQFLGAALQSQCAGAELRVRWSSAAKLTYELRSRGGASHHAFTARLSAPDRVARK